MNIKQTLSATLLGVFMLPVLAGEKVDQQLPASAENNVEIENIRGNVSIIGWDKEQVSVVGELDDKTEQFIFERRANSILIKVKVPGHFGHGSFSQGAGSDLTIKLPKHSKMNFSGVSTDVIVENLQQRSEINVVSGSIKASNLANSVDFSTVSGDIISNNLTGKISLATVSGDLRDENSAGRLSLSSVSGNIKANSSATEVNAHAVSGEISLDLANVDLLELQTVSDDVTVNLTLNSNGSIDASSVSGNVSLNFQQDIQASFRVTSNAGGRINNKLSDDKAIEAKYGPGSKLRFETGNGNGSVQVSTVSGNIKLARQ
jgi:DUF4097 and DUF4098 domain-containing protein YvlB